jgi:bifunctional DNA-binding transcriptional regulator/antitoxin component of YhaV-PrlF toxin-antitoxin module
MKITERGTITLPKQLRERCGLTHDVEVEALETADGILLRKKTRSDDPVSKWRGVLKTPFDVDAYIEEIRGR